MSKCINCEQPVTTQYCGHCGQQQSLKPHTQHQFLIDLWDTLTLINSPLKNTIKLLWLSPGRFVKDYVTGKQVGVLGPIQFFIMILAIYVIILPFIIDHSLFELTTQLHQVNDLDSNNNAFNSQSIQAKVPELMEFVKQAVNFFYFILPFTLALYLPKPNNQSESGLILSASFYFVAMSLILVMPILLLSLWKSFFIGGRFLLAISYFTFAYRSFYQNIIDIKFISLLLRIILGYLTYMLVIFIIMSIWLSLKLLA